MAEKRAVAVVATSRSIQLISLFLLVSFSIFGQEKSKPLTPPPEVNLLYNYYSQDGSNSAVTGGTGTEELDYHAPVIIVNIPTDSNSSITVNMGIDIYSSASQDNIDFNVSSASARDARSHITLGYSHSNEDKEQSFETHGSFSIESDYTSFGLGGYYSKGWNNYNSALTLSAQIFMDDCRWGRLNPGQEELILIYPVELRGTEWESEYMRYTSTLSIGFNRLLTKRLKVGLFIDGVWQSGLLATTFHRIYFSDTTFKAIEKLPYQRLKLPIGLRVNYFPFRWMLVRSYYRFYVDDWGINAHTIELEPSFKINPIISIFPFYRYYFQSATQWFNPYKEHSIQQEFYTSDYDLSRFSAHKFGIGMSFRTVGTSPWGRRNFGWQGMEFRLGTYQRSNGLEAFFFSTAFHFGSLY